MTIFKKTFLILILVITIIIILYSALIYLTSNQYFQKQEKKLIESSINRAVDNFNYEISNLDTINNDWSSWDDTYSFIEDNNADYITSNLSESTMVLLELGLITFINSNNEIIYSRGYDFASGKEIPIPQDFKSVFFENKKLKELAAGSSIKGFILFSGRPMIITARPILTTDDEGPARGVLVMGKFLDVKIASLSQLLRFNVKVVNLDDYGLSNELRGKLLSLNLKNPHLIELTGKNSAYGYSLLTDIFGNPTMYLEVEIPRDIYNQSTNIIITIMIAGIILIIIISFLIFFLLTRMFRRKLESSSNLQRIKIF
jgi:sensor domain CHASE-containing protein